MWQGAEAPCQKPPEKAALEEAPPARSAFRDRTPANVFISASGKSQLGHPWISDSQGQTANVGCLPFQSKVLGSNR